MVRVDCARKGTGLSFVDDNEGGEDCCPSNRAENPCYESVRVAVRFGEVQ